MSFVSLQPVRFAHVDAAGIVFYPRYFEMLNAAVEDFFATVIGVDFATLHLVRGIGLPTVRLEVSFAAPSRLGEQLAFDLTPVQVGTSSAEFFVEVTCRAETRLSVRLIVVCMNLAEARSLPWPDDVRPRVQDAPAASALANSHGGLG